MPAVWQTLIPETPSIEPISIIIDELQNTVEPSSNNRCYQQTPNYHGNHLLSPPPASKHRNLSGGSNNNNTTTDHGQHCLENNTVNNTNGASNTTTSGNESSSKSHRAFHRITSSINCGEQFWRFYSDWSERRQGSEKRKRFFLKNGVYNTRHVNVFGRTQRYIGDIFTTLVDARWRWTLIVFSTSYILSWIGFAIIWWVIVSAHGDLDNWNDPEWQPCVVGVKSFASVFLFSLETQHTIGYGTRYMNDSCPDAILVLVCQSVAGVLIEAFMVGVVFAKLSRPKKRAQTLIFSKNAVISQRDGRLFLMFRVGDMRSRSSLFECHVRAQVITKRVTTEGEVLPIHQEEIKVGGYGEDEERILLFWPTIIVHPLDSESPFYKMSSAELLKAKLEVIVVLEGVVESTGMTTQLRTSFLPSEILWGHRFRDLSSFKTELGQHVFDFELFNSTFPVDTPLCSAHELETLRHFNSPGSLNGNVTEPVSPEESLEKDSEDEADAAMRRQLRRKSNVEVTIVNGMKEDRRLAPLEFCDDDESESEDDDNEHSRITTSTRRMGGSRRESICSLDSIIVSSSNV